jgi:predicted RNA binding protein YcfA (HicA-like mRNA interferase family)
MSHRKSIQKLLNSKGFELVRSKNHMVYRNAQGQTVIVPNHNKMNEITFRKLIKQVEAA